MVSTFVNEGTLQDYLLLRIDAFLLKRNTQSGMYRAVCRHVYLGYYDSPIDAARAYDRKAKQLYGGFARINFRRGDAR